MLESLDINGRTYITSEAASHEVGYQPSYIERLARGKWIDASFVQGQCFVDVASLMAFIAASEEEQASQLRAAMERERIEATLSRYEEILHATNDGDGPWVVIGKVGVVTMCGLLVGLLSLSAVEAELTWREFSDGVVQTATVLQERIVPSGMPAALLEALNAFDW